MNFRVGNNANNIFSNGDSSISRLRSTSGGGSESDFRSLSQKDSHGMADQIKDELEYQISMGRADQDEGWDMDEIERTFGIFGD